MSSKTQARLKFFLCHSKPIGMEEENTVSVHRNQVKDKIVKKNQTKGHHEGKLIKLKYPTINHHMTMK
jgi:hypothetical protein